MKPAPFDYLKPDTLDEAAALCQEFGSDGRILAGGQSLMAMLNMRLAAPSVLIDVSGLEEASYIRANQEHIAIGCATRQCELERWERLAEALPLIAQVMPWIGHSQTRSRGTVCGSLAHADPSSELPLCLALLDGQVVLRSGDQAREVSGRAFFKGLLQTACGVGELISEVRLPHVPAGHKTAFSEMAIRHGDFAIIAVGVIARPDGLTIAVGGATDRPEVRDWPLLGGAELEDALNEFAWALECSEDLHASASYRRHLIRTLGKKTVQEATG